jgi:hypothetical protein
VGCLRVALWRFLVGDFGDAPVALAERLRALEEKREGAGLTEGAALLLGPLGESVECLDDAGLSAGRQRSERV